MQHPVFTIDWSRGRVAWLVLRPLRDLSVATALEAAAERLRKSSAELTTAATGATLHFKVGSGYRRSWLACVADGRVEAVPIGDQLSVTVGGRVRKLFVVGALGVLAGILGFPATWVIGVAAFLSGGNYLYAHFGLLRVAEAVAWAASAKRAA